MCSEPPEQKINGALGQNVFCNLLLKGQELKEQFTQK